MMTALAAPVTGAAATAKNDGRCCLQGFMRFRHMLFCSFAKKRKWRKALGGTSSLDDDGGGSGVGKCQAANDAGVGGNFGVGGGGGDDDDAYSALDVFSGSKKSSSPRLFPPLFSLLLALCRN